MSNWLSFYRRMREHRCVAKMTAPFAPECLWQNRVSGAIDREKIAAELKDGVLAVCLAKSESVKPSMIEITG